MATTPTSIYDLAGDGSNNNMFSLTLEDAYKNTIIDVDDGADNLYGLTVWLYEDPAFTNWKTHVEQSSINASLPANQKNYILDYSSYNIAIQCNLTKIDGNDSVSANKGGWGCCLRDDSELRGGGYCLRLNTVLDGVDTYYVSES